MFEDMEMRIMEEGIDDNDFDLQARNFGPDTEQFIDANTWIYFAISCLLDHVIILAYYLFMSWFIFETMDGETLLLLGIISTVFPFVYIKLAIVSLTRLGYSDSTLFCFWIYLVQDNNQQSAHRKYSNIYMLTRNIVFTMIILFLNGLFAFSERSKALNHTLVNNL